MTFTGEDGLLARPYRVSRTLTRWPEQVTLAGQFWDQRPKALPRFRREVAQRGDVEHAEGRIRRRLGDYGETSSGTHDSVAASESRRRHSEVLVSLKWPL